MIHLDFTVQVQVRMIYCGSQRFEKFIFLYKFLGDE